MDHYATATHDTSVLATHQDREVINQLQGKATPKHTHCNELYPFATKHRPIPKPTHRSI